MEKIFDMLISTIQIGPVRNSMFVKEDLRRKKKRKNMKDPLPTN